MLSQAAVFALVQQLGGSNNNIIYNAKFIDYCGGCHYSALLLAQLLYWSDKTRLEGGWIAKTKDEWFNELRLTPYKMRLAEAKLRDELGVLEIDVFKFRGFPTNHYRFRQEAFVASFVKFFEDGYSKVLSNGVTQNFSQSNVKSFEQPITYTTKTDTTADTTFEISGSGKPGRIRKKVDSSESSATEAPQTEGPGRKNSDTSICPVFRPAQAKFEEAYQQKFKMPYRFSGGKDGKALKAILTHLRKMGNGDWDIALELFGSLVDGWDNLPDFYRGNMELSFFNSQLTKILNHVKLTVSGENSSKPFTGSDF
jgi:hypothetical protein